jgi:hypothetical protein
MILGIFALLAFVPLLGIVAILMSGSLFTVDGLFMSLILLTVSGVFGTTSLFEWRHNGFGGKAKTGAAPAPSQAFRATAASGGSAVRGRVQDVQFYEADVGQPNKSIVTLADGAKGAQTLVFEGDLRNALPIGQKVQVTYRKQSGLNSLLDVTYS